MIRTEGGELAHGYLVPGGAEALKPLHAFLAEKGVAVEGNPDVFEREYKLFTVDDARALRDRAQSRAIGKRGRVFIVVTPSMTNEAQNALLKTLEEPRAGAVFFFVVPSPSALLATLRSRVQLLSFEQTPMSRPRLDIDTQEFLAAPTEKRLDMLKPLYRHDEDDERDLRPAVAFLQELEDALSLRVSDVSVQEGIRSVYRARKYLMDKGALLKPLLEQVALLTPRV